MAQESSRSRLSLTAAEILSTGIQTWIHRKHTLENIWMDRILIEGSFFVLDIDMTSLLTYFLNMNMSKNVEVSLLARVSVLRILQTIGPSCMNLFLKEFLTPKHIQLVQSSFIILSYGIIKVKWNFFLVGFLLTRFSFFFFLI